MCDENRKRCCGRCSCCRWHHPSVRIVGGDTVKRVLIFTLVFVVFFAVMAAPVWAEMEDSKGPLIGRGYSPRPFSDPNTPPGCIGIVILMLPAFVLLGIKTVFAHWATHKLARDGALLASSRASPRPSAFGTRTKRRANR